MSSICHTLQDAAYATPHPSHHTLQDAAYATPHPSQARETLGDLQYVAYATLWPGAGNSGSFTVLTTVGLLLTTVTTVDYCDSCVVAYAA